MRLSLKLGLLCAIVALLPFLLLTLFVLSSGTSANRTASLEQLQTNSRVVAGFYEKRLETMRAAAAQLAIDVANKALVSSDNQQAENGAAMARLQDLLPRAQNDYSLDFLIVADSTGRVIARHNDRPRPGESLTAGDELNPIAAKVIADAGQLRNLPTAGTVVESVEQLTRLGLESVAQVRAGNEVKTSDALVMEAAAPIFSNGRFVGVVLIGQMLNNYYKGRSGNSLQTPLVAETRPLIQRGDQTAGAVIALGSTIIASSVMAANGGDRPLLLGANHQADATTETITEENRRYAVAWQPVKSPDGIVIGSLGAVLAESDMATGISFTRLLIPGLIAALLAGALGYFVGSTLASRLKRLSKAASRMGLGELSAPVRDDAFFKKSLSAFLFKDEVANLGKQMDEMRESFRQAIERMKKR
jgi:HAMP domain-containing protein